MRTSQSNMVLFASHCLLFTLCLFVWQARADDCSVDQQNRDFAIAVPRFDADSYALSTPDLGAYFNGDTKTTDLEWLDQQGGFRIFALYFKENGTSNSKHFRVASTTHCGIPVPFGEVFAVKVTHRIK